MALVLFMAVQISQSRFEALVITKADKFNTGICVIIKLETGTGQSSEPGKTRGKKTKPQRTTDLRLKLFRLLTCLIKKSIISNPFF